MWRWLGLTFVCLGWSVLYGCGSTGGNDNPFAGYESELYGGLDNWLCHPDLADEDDLCKRNLDTTLVSADGTATIETHTPASNPEVDCFYVYPTVSADQGANSDLMVNEEERFTILNQAARYNRVCRVFAPVYRQATLSGIFTGDENVFASAYADVLDAFKEYIANHNDDRGFILIGHSQGTGHLSVLLRDEIENNDYLSSRLIAAHLIGIAIGVPEGEDVGGFLANTPLCRSADQTGCLIAYSSFRSTEPPDPETALFGDPDEPGQQAACTNPGALADGGPALLTPYFPTEVTGVFADLVGTGGSPYASPDEEDPITTPFFGMPEFIRAECVTQGQFSFLEITIVSDEEDPRADDVEGDLTTGWGLHIVDMTLAMGELISLAESQAKAWLDGQ